LIDCKGFPYDIRCAAAAAAGNLAIIGAKQAGK
jgi:hypothetical protein